MTERNIFWNIFSIYTSTMTNCLFWILFDICFFFFTFFVYEFILVTIHWHVAKVNLAHKLLPRLNPQQKRFAGHFIDLKLTLFFLPVRSLTIIFRLVRLTFVIPAAHLVVPVLLIIIFSQGSVSNSCSLINRTVGLLSWIAMGHFKVP